MENTQTLTNENQATETPEKRHVFSDETYQLLTNAQKTIYEKTEIRITLRKLLDRLITKSEIEKATNEFIAKFND